MDELPQIVSVDDHVVEPPMLWLDRLPDEYRDRAPHCVRELVSMVSKPGTTKWADVWYYEGNRVEVTRGFAAVSYADPDDLENEAMLFEEMRPGAFHVDARLRDMDEDSVEASVCFPNAFVRFCGQRFLTAKDKDLALLCVRAYNDWLVDEWAGPSDGRLFGAGIVPLWDPQLAAAEVRRIAARGMTSVCFSEIPPRLGLPSLYSAHWDPFLESCEDTGTVINLHIGSSSDVHTSSSDAPAGVRVANHFHNSAFSVTDWLVSGALVKFPGLKIAFSEGQGGWLPYLLTRLDRLWSSKAPLIGFNSLPKPPSSYVRDHVYLCIFDDPVAVALAERFGTKDIYQLSFDNLMFETDYPHNDSTWPHSRSRALELTAGLSEANREKMLRTNAAALYRIDRVISGRRLSASNVT